MWRVIAPSACTNVDSVQIIEQLSRSEVDIKTELVKVG
jgi:hypothetical protein